MGAIEGKELKSAVCPMCQGFSSKRLTSFEAHLMQQHGKTSKEVWDGINGGPVRCACGCGAETKWNGWWNGYSKVVNGHNGSIYKVCSTEDAVRISEQRSQSLKGKQSWAKGLTKESDERVRKRGEATSVGRKTAFDEGTIAAWNKGLTAEEDERVAAAAAGLKEKYSTGEAVPWSKGLTKESDERVAAMSMNVSLVMRQESIRKRLDGMKRLPSDEIRDRVEARGKLKVIGGLESYVNDAQKAIQVQCIGCNEVFFGSLRSLQYGKCFKCSPGGSLAQEMVAKWVESLGVEVKRNDRSVLPGGLELDIHVESKSVAVEYNGLYWHSHAGRSSSYHSNKTISASKMGITLVHVFEDEWRDKPDIIKSMIVSRLKMSHVRVGARKCSVRQLTTAERSQFFDENHIDGDVAAAAAWGLFQGDVLVYSLSVRRPFHKKDGVMEVARCCPKKYHNVPGGLSRLVEVAVSWCREKDYAKLMTYVDTRHGGSGSGYAAAGFKVVNRTPPRFWWTDFDNRFNRFKYKADSKNGLTESDVAEAAGVVKIWGCENVVYEMNL
jgi:hypothetical protein